MHFKPSLLLLAFALAGCSAPNTGRPLTRELAANNPDAQLDFWHSLADHPITSNDEAFHGLLLYLDNKDDSADYAARVATLQSRKMLPAGFNEAPDAAIRRGTLALAITRIVKARGGVTMALLGPSQRYAVRELQFLGLYPPSTPNQSFSGNEYLGIIGRLEDYQRGDPANVPAAVLPEQMKASG